MCNFAQNRRFLEQNVLSPPRRSSSPNYRIPMRVEDIRRRWANFGPFSPKMWAPFLWLSRLEKTRFSASRMGGFRRCSFNDGKSSSVNSLPPIIFKNLSMCDFAKHSLVWTFSKCTSHANCVWKRIASKR